MTLENYKAFAKEVDAPVEAKTYFERLQLNVKTTLALSDATFSDKGYNLDAGRGGFLNAEFQFQVAAKKLGKKRATGALVRADEWIESARKGKAILEQNVLLMEGFRIKGRKDGSLFRPKEYIEAALKELSPEEDEE